VDLTLQLVDDEQREQGNAYENDGKPAQARQASDAEHDKEESYPSEEGGKEGAQKQPEECQIDGRKGQCLSSDGGANVQK
jgi:hypothetical protein